MSNYHKPRTFRSLNGCCICRAKSSSSRFTDSEKYEHDFRECFRIEDERSGDICNACVLLVKRWKKLPRGSKKHWNHVVDARAGPGGFKGSLVRQKSKQSGGSGRDDPDLKIRKIVRKRPSSSTSISCYEPVTPTEDAEDAMRRAFADSPTGSDDDEVSNHSAGSVSNCADSEEVSPFLNLTYWKRTPVCCGVVFLGPMNELMIDAKLYKPCLRHKKPSASSSAGSSGDSVSGRTRTDTFSSNSSLPQNPESPTPSSAAAVTSSSQAPAPITPMSTSTVTTSESA